MKKLLQALSLCTIVLFSASIFSCSNSVSTNKSDGNSSQEQGNGQGEGQDSEQGGGQGSSETSPYNTENEVIQQILSMTESGTIKVTGEITQSLLTDIATALKELYKKNDSIRINLDMGESFGIKSIKTTFAELQNLESIILPSGIINITPKTFKDCPNLKSLVIQEGVQSLSNNFFEEIPSLEIITLPASFKSLPDSFGSDLNYNNCNLSKIIINDENPYFKIVDGVIYNYDMTKLYFYPKTKTDKSFTIETELQGYNSFKNITNSYLEELIISSNINFSEMYSYNCPNLKTLKLENKNIDLSSIYYQETITTIVLSASVESIKFRQRDALSFSKLSNIIVEENNQNFKSIDGILYSKDGSKIIYCPEEKDLTNFVISENVKTIGSWAFASTRLSKIDIPGTVETIEDYAFSFCIVKEINLSNGIKSIGEGAFVTCNWDRLTKLCIPSSVKFLGNGCFNGYPSIDELIISEGITEIQENAFGCAYISTLILPKTIKKLDDYCFSYSRIETIYFTGSEEEWNQIEKSETWNEGSTINKIVFNYSAEGNE